MAPPIPGALDLFTAVRESTKVSSLTGFDLQSFAESERQRINERSNERINMF